MALLAFCSVAFMAAASLSLVLALLFTAVAIANPTRFTPEMALLIGALYVTWRLLNATKTPFQKLLRSRHLQRMKSL